MKRHFYTLGLMLAATFTLTNCAQEIDNPNDVPSAGIPFEIVANSAETKTANSASVVSWVAGDASVLCNGKASHTPRLSISLSISGRRETALRCPRR